MSSTESWLARLPHRRHHRVVAVDTHTGGELTRVVLTGGPDLPPLDPGSLREYFAEHHDRLRQRLTWEPRGNRDVVLAWLTPPHTAGADFGVLFMDAQRYPLACGTATVGAVTAALEVGVATPRGGKVRLDTPAGPVESHVTTDPLRVSIDMVDACMMAMDQRLVLDGHPFTAHLGFVGGFLLMVEASQLPFPIDRSHGHQMVDLGMRLIEQANAHWSVTHPRTGNPATVDGVVLFDASGHPEGFGTVVYGASHLDRSPCGTGTTVKMAWLHARGELQVGDQFRNRGILGTTFTGHLTDTTRVGSHPGIKVRLDASAYLTAFHEFFVSPDDPLEGGYLVGS